MKTVFTSLTKLPFRFRPCLSVYVGSFQDLRPSWTESQIAATPPYLYQLFQRATLSDPDLRPSFEDLEVEISLKIDDDDSAEEEKSFTESDGSLSSRSFPHPTEVLDSIVSADSPFEQSWQPPSAFGGANEVWNFFEMLISVHSRRWGSMSF